MDLFYGEECHLDGHGFAYALTLLTTVTSHPTPERILTDAGFKALSTRAEMAPLVLGRPDLELVYLSAEHGRWSRGPDSPEVAIGDRLVILPDYHDTTTFRHDEFVGVRDGRVEVIIPLLGRGRRCPPDPSPGVSTCLIMRRHGRRRDRATGPPADVGIRGDRIVALGTIPDAGAATRIDATGRPSRPASSTRTSIPRPRCAATATATARSSRASRRT